MNSEQRAKLNRFRRAENRASRTADRKPCPHAEFKMKKGCCGDYWVCRRPGGRKEGIVVKGKYCRKRCEEKDMVEAPQATRFARATLPEGNLPKLSMIFTAWNEDHKEVLATLQSALDAYPTDRLQLILVDDGSGKPLADLTDMDGLKIVRHEKPLGVGAARNAGYAAATGDVISFHDAHMRFPLYDELLNGCRNQFKDALKEQLLPGDSCLTVLARKALETDACLCSASRDVRRERSFWASGADLFWNRNDGLQAKWRIYPAEDPWPRVPCMMGAAYFFSRKTAERLTAATDRLWEDTAGRWGMSEQAMGVKAFLLGIPTIAARDVFTRHLYRGKNPVPDAGREVWKNVARSMSVLFSERTFNLRFRSHVLKRMTEKDLAEIIQQRNVQGPVWPDAAVFTHLCGKGARITSRHPDHSWMEVFSRPRDPEPVRDYRRVLQWRPGESTILLRERLPEADITCIETPGHRADNWWDICNELGVKLIKSQLGSGYANLPLIREWAPFDLILVGGEMQEQCMAVARQVLAPGGRIIRNERADRLQIEDAERKKEKELIKSTTKARRHEGKQNAGQEGKQQRAGKQPQITVMLLNYRRSENIGPIMDCLQAQTARPEIRIWNNGTPLLFNRGGTDLPIHQHEVVSLSVRPSQNLLCFPRWWLASLADTEYVCSMDDDILLRDERVLEDAMAACREECPDGIVGFFGATEVEGKGYKGWRHHNGTSKGTRCDMIKGRFMLFRRELLGRVPLLVPGLDHREDDIYLSLCISGGKPGAHLVPARLGKRWTELPQRGTSMASEGGHYQRRGAFYRTLKAHLTGDQK